MNAVTVVSGATGGRRTLNMTGGERNDAKTRIKQKPTKLFLFLCAFRAFSRIQYIDSECETSSAVSRISAGGISVSFKDLLRTLCFRMFFEIDCRSVMLRNRNSRRDVRNYRMYFSRRNNRRRFLWLRRNPSVG